MRRLSGRRHAPAPPGCPAVCGPCGERFGTQAALDEHQGQGRCLVPREAPPAGAVRMLSNATVALMDRLPAREAGAVSSAIYRAAVGLSVEQRARLAWLVDEVSDAVDTVARRAAREAATS